LSATRSKTAARSSCTRRHTTPSSPRTRAPAWTAFWCGGLNPHGWGYQPSWYCQFLDNEILEGNGYGTRAASFGTIGSDEAKAFGGALVRGTVFRRNMLRNNAGFSVGGMTEDTLVENNIVKNSESGVKVRASARGTLLRGNTFEGVLQPVLEEPQTPVRQKVN